MRFPQWTDDPRPGTAELTAALPAPAGDRLPAAHALVVAALTGDAGEVEDAVVGDGTPDRDVALCVWATGSGLRLRYRLDAVDEAYAARLAGYYAAALAGAESPADLVDAREHELQVHGFAGPSIPLPDTRVHEVFEERARRHPDRVAAVFRDRALTYAELNRDANRVAHALLSSGLRREDVVAVVAERTLDWLVAVLAILKAGGAYLPVEPHFPADRVAGMITRSGCRFALTDGAADVPGLVGYVAAVGELVASDGPVTDPGVRVDADQLAYIYFTSGSTGLPKGAMCEQAGMLNHLYAKIEDFGIGSGTVVAQTAPQCFDISLWQLVSALLVGGTTLIVEQEAVHDVPRWVDRVVGGGVAVLQVVPSFLDVVLSHLEEHPRDLGALACVSATGEALKPDLARRWFAAYPGIRLANAYGLTETSDDTNHEVMTEAPDRVLLGPAVRNVAVYLVDEDLRPVPLGAPGEIVFSGVCVGRGYVNDPERTAAAFGTDPHRPGERLYRSGDFGRWRPGRKLEFLGRRDSQVKISGFRIELGEIENRLTAIPGIGDGAVIAAGTPGGDRRLAAFYSSPSAVDADEVRAGLAAALPHYMVPASITRMDSLPLNGNGKIDKKALAALAEPTEPAGGTAAEPLTTPTEHRVARLWSELLKVPATTIGRHDDFFTRGGTSLTAIRLALRLGEGITPRDLLGNSTLADLAELLDTRASA